MAIEQKLQDRFGGEIDVSSGPATHFFEITPHDSNYLEQVTRGIYVGTTGNLEVQDTRGNAATFVAVPAGTVLALRATRVLSTGTTASNIVGMA